MTRLAAMLLAWLIALAPVARAADNSVTMTPGSGVTFRSIDVGSSVQSMVHIIGNTSGTAIYGTAGTANAAVLSIQGIASMTPLLVTLPTGASTSALQTTGNTALTTINTTLGSPFQAGGSIGNAFALDATLTTMSGKLPTSLTTAGADGVSNTLSGLQSYSRLQMFNGTTWDRLLGDTTSGIWVNIKAGAGSGGTALADEAAFTQGTTNVTPMGCLYATSITNLTAGQAGVVRCTNDRTALVTVANTNPNGSATSANSSPVVIASDQVAIAVKAASGTIASGAIASGAVSSGAFASGSVASGAYASGSIASGAMVDLGAQADTACATDNGTCTEIALTKRTNQRLTTIIAGIPVTNAGTFAVQSAATLSAETTKVIGTVRNLGNAGGVFDAVIGAAPPANGLQVTALTSGATGGLVQPLIQCDQKAIYDASTSGSTELVALTSGRTIYICGKTVFAAGTVNVKLIYGTGTACATGSNNLTPAYQLTAQVGLVEQSPFYRGSKTASANALCLNTSAGIAVQAEVYYAVL